MPPASRAPIAAKGQWVKANGVGGTIIWTINYGCTNRTSGDNPLLDAVRTAFLAPQATEAR